MYHINILNDFITLKVFKNFVLDNKFRKFNNFHTNVSIPIIDSTEIIKDLFMKQYSKDEDYMKSEHPIFYGSLNLFNEIKEICEKISKTYKIKEKDILFQVIHYSLCRKLVQHLKIGNNMKKFKKDIFSAIKICLII